MLPDQDVALSQEGGLGLITLQRERSLNTTTLPMIRTITKAMRAWEADETIKAVLIRGQGKVFCAGGDVRRIVHYVQEDLEKARGFLREEYQLIRRLHRFSKPYISLWHGCAMGGGLGLSAHGSHRIIDERCVTAMPEVAIGFIPDVGGSWFLGRLRHSIGHYMALTASHLNASQTLQAGLATHHIPAQRFDAFVEALKEASLTHSQGASWVDALLESFASDLPPGWSSEELEVIETCFSNPDLDEVFKRLQGSPLGKQVSFESLCPTSLRVVEEQFKRAPTLSFDACMLMEYRLTASMALRADFPEGVRALLVDKDRNPHWTPERLEDVAPVASYFDTPLVDDLVFEGE